MATLTVWRFDSPYGARNALDLLGRLRKEELLQLDDAAIVTWPEDRKKPKTEQLQSMAAMGALGGSFWGLLFGLLFFIPLLGMAVGGRGRSAQRLVRRRRYRRQLHSQGP
jgi:uncharacterized membrane protein